MALGTIGGGRLFASSSARCRHSDSANAAIARRARPEREKATTEMVWFILLFRSSASGGGEEEGVMEEAAVAEGEGEGDAEKSVVTMALKGPRPSMLAAASWE